MGGTHVPLQRQPVWQLFASYVRVQVPLLHSLGVGVFGAAGHPALTSRLQSAIAALVRGPTTPYPFVSGGPYGTTPFLVCHRCTAVSVYTSKTPLTDP